MRRDRRAFWIAFGATALPFILVAWIARAILGTARIDLGIYYFAFWTVLVLFFGGVVALAVGLLIVSVEQAKKRPKQGVASRVGWGVLAGAMVGIMGGAGSCYAALPTTT